MEIHPGVFVSSTSTDAWRSDPEVGGGAEEHVLSDPDPPPWVLPQTEVLLVLAVTHWHLTLPFKEMWVLAGD